MSSSVLGNHVKLWDHTPPKPRGLEARTLRPGNSNTTHRFRPSPQPETQSLQPKAVEVLASRGLGFRGLGFRVQGLGFRA